MDKIKLSGTDQEISEKELLFLYVTPGAIHQTPNGDRIEIVSWYNTTPPRPKEYRVIKTFIV